MPSSKIVQLARTIVREDNAIFETLAEFERTKQLRTKTRLNFTVDKSVAARFKRYCRNKGYNMSAKVEQAMDEIVRKMQ